MYKRRASQPQGPLPFMTVGWARLSSLGLSADGQGRWPSLGELSVEEINSDRALAEMGRCKRGEHTNSLQAEAVHGRHTGKSHDRGGSRQGWRE